MNNSGLRATEVYRLWLDKFSPPCTGGNCIHGLISGGPGYVGFDKCELPQHSSVRYGCDYCPDTCPDAEYNSDLTTFKSFVEYACNPALNSLITDYIDVDIQAIDEVKAYNAKIVSEKRRKELGEEQSFYKVVSMDLPTEIQQSDPFTDYQ